MSASKTLIKHLTRTAEAINFSLKTNGYSPLVSVPKMKTLEDIENFSDNLNNIIKFPHLRYLSSERVARLTKSQSKYQDKT